MMNGNTSSSTSGSTSGSNATESQHPPSSSNYHWNATNLPGHYKKGNIDTTQEATLTVSILSVYDLPYREPPSYVSLSLPSAPSTILVRTGPPTQRHRDRNSFKFGTTTTPTATSTTTMALPSVSSPKESVLSRTLTITHSNLSELYHAVAKFEVVYVTTTHHPTTMTRDDVTTTTTTTSFTSRLPLSKCHINETMWNILVCHTIPQSTSYTTNTSTGITSTVPHPMIATLPTTPNPTKRVAALPFHHDQQQDPSDFTDHDQLHTTPPTIRIQMTLTGPYRSEIRTLLQYGTRYLQLLDQMEQSIAALPVSQFVYHRILVPSWRILRPPMAATTTSESTTRSSPTRNTMIYWTIVFLIVPLVVMIGLILIPILAGLFMITLPFLFPVVCVVMAMVCATSCTGFVYYCTSTALGGRTYVYQTILYPIIQTILSSKIGQHMVYDIGPRYQPIILLLHQYHIVPVGNDAVLQKFLFCILIDFIGSTSYFVPGIGEFMDIVWAPAQTLLIMALFDNNNDDDDENAENNNNGNPNTPSYASSTTTTTTTRTTASTTNDSSKIYHEKVTAVLPYISFIEEVLPFTDFIPTATIGWFCIYGIVPLIANNNNNDTTSNLNHGDRKND